MIILNNTTDKIQIVLASGVTTNQLSCYASYRDLTSTGFTAGRSITTTNSLTNVDLVPAPSASTITRVIDVLSVYNNDTQPATVNIKYNANGTICNLFNAPISTGSTLSYLDCTGFRCIDFNGNIKQESGVNPITSPFNKVSLSSDLIYLSGGTTNKVRTVTGMSFTMGANKTYYYQFNVSYDINAAATGSRWFLTGGSFNYLAAKSSYSLDTTSQTLNHAVIAYNSPASTSNTSAASTGNFATVEGIITTTASSTLQLLMAIETAAGTMTVKKGSCLYWQELF